MPLNSPWGRHRVPRYAAFVVLLVLSVLLAVACGDTPSCSDGDVCAATESALQAEPDNGCLLGKFRAADLPITLTSTVSQASSVLRVEKTAVIGAAYLSLRVENAEEVEATLESPSGTRMLVHTNGSIDVTEAVRLPVFAGEQAAGTWTLHVSRAATAAHIFGDARLRSWSLMLVGEDCESTVRGAVLSHSMMRFIQEIGK
jgi:subtilisin-like proprotein convertase family protein